MVIATIPLTLVVDESELDYGWIYNFQTGDVIANTDDSDAGGTPYASY